MHRSTFQIQHKENYKEEMLSDMKIYALEVHLVKAIKLVLLEEPENECYECLRYHVIFMVLITQNVKIQFLLKNKQKWEHQA